MVQRTRISMSIDICIIASDQADFTISSQRHAGCAAAAATIALAAQAPCRVEHLRRWQRDSSRLQHQRRVSRTAELRSERRVPNPRQIGTL